MLAANDFMTLAQTDLTKAIEVLKENDYDMSFSNNKEFFLVQSKFPEGTDFLKVQKLIVEKNAKKIVGLFISLQLLTNKWHAANLGTVVDIALLQTLRDAAPEAIANLITTTKKLMAYIKDKKGIGFHASVFTNHMTIKIKIMELFKSHDDLIIAVEDADVSDTHELVKMIEIDYLESLIFSDQVFFQIAEVNRVLAIAIGVTLDDRLFTRFTNRDSLLQLKTISKSLAVKFAEKRNISLEPMAAPELELEPLAPPPYVPRRPTPLQLPSYEDIIESVPTFTPLRSPERREEDSVFNFKTLCALGMVTGGILIVIGLLTASSVLTIIGAVAGVASFKFFPRAEPRDFSLEGPMVDFSP